MTRAALEAVQKSSFCKLQKKTSPVFPTGLETSVLQGVRDPGGAASCAGVCVLVHLFRCV